MFIPIQIAAVIAIVHPGLRPFPLKQVNAVTAREEAAIYAIKSLNRAQQAFYIENERFATDLSLVLPGSPTHSESYLYQVIGIDQQIGIQLAKPRTMNLRSVVGAVIPDAQGSLVTIICRSLMPGLLAPSPIAQNGRLVCAAGTEIVR